MTTSFEEAARVLRAAHDAIAVTGAGISVESGISPFRGAGGIWTKYPAEEYATLEGYLENPAKVWQFWRELAAELGPSEPNLAHRALADLESRGLLKAVITQNIDNLHQKAGSKHVVEYHGNAGALRCLDCGAINPLDWRNTGDRPPRCTTCSGLMKPDVVMFGELIPREAAIAAEQLALQADLVLVVGTSATVYPAAGLPYIAKQRGAFIIEANTETTGFTETITDVFIEGPAGETLPRLVELVAGGE